MTTPAGQGAASASSSRLASLDVFRGFIMASMVMVNNQLGRDAYAQLRHAEWDGLTFTDLVFPSFLWIAGVATTLSIAVRLERGQSRTTLLGHAFRRAALLFLIGLALNSLSRFDLATIRIPGVLQRIALCYLLGTLIYLWTGVRGRLVAVLGLFAVYWIAMAPGGYSMEGNVGAQLDRWLMPGHLYTPVYDPEGLLTSLPAVATFLFGILTGDLLRTRKSSQSRTVWLLGAGAALVVVGYALAAPFQPINKALWTVPYTLVTAGLASLMFGACYWFADVRGHHGSWTVPYSVFGVNAIAVYVFHYLVAWTFSRTGLRTALRSPLEAALSAADASLVYSLIHVGLSLAFAWFLWRRRIFLKV